jgi:ribosomal-protein-alanine N-acetyltransferase
MHAVCFPDEPWSVPALDRILELTGIFGHVAWNGGDPAGFAVARDLGDEAEVIAIGVLPEDRRRGAGRALIEAVIAGAARRRLGSVVLEVAVDNEAARRLYRSCGFLQVGRRPRYYRNKSGITDALILRRCITAEPPLPQSEPRS